MKLDQTFIAIHERGILDICDLSLHVVRDHFKPLLTLLLLGSLPWVLIDLWLVGWLVLDGAVSGNEPMFYWLTALLVVSQAQLGTNWLTCYLGQAMFEGRPHVWETIRGSWRTPIYFYWIHGAIRLVLPTMFFVWLTRYSDEDTLYGLGLMLVPLLVAVTWLIRSLRPFVSEILLLEKTPIKRSRSHPIDFKRRSQALHGRTGSDLFGRAFLVAIFIPLMAFAFYAMFASADSVLNLQVNEESSLAPFFWIAALWLAAGFAAVVRFLSYIDVRIRQEGWAVELKMRAEGQRLAGH